MVVLVSIAKENLIHEKMKISMSIGGVVLSVFLIFTILGVYNGMEYTMESIVYKTGADLWITQQDTSGSLHSPSIITLDIADQLKSVDGIEDFTPLIRTATTYRVGEDNVLLFINGYNSTGSLGNPWSIVSGKKNPDLNEIIIDSVFASKYGFSIGQNITISSRDYKIVGLSDETNIMIGFMIFLSFEDARNFIFPNTTNSFLISVENGASISSVQSGIKDIILNVDVLTSDQVAKAYKDEVLGSFIPIILVLSVISLFVGTLVIALLIYMLTLEKSKEYGIIKAIGASNFHLYKIVLSQSMAISFIGYIIGVVVSIPLINLIQYFIPEFLTVITGEMILWGFLLFIITGIFASFIPVKRLTTIDPALVFKA